VYRYAFLALLQLTLFVPSRSTGTLIFGYCYFEWPGVPSFLGSLVLLEKLDMSFTLFHGDINAPVFAKLSNLKYLEMGGNSYNSTIPSEIYQLPLLERFYIQNSFVEGNLEFIKSMPVIFELWLDDNPGMVGTIPTEIGNLKTLESISFSGCKFYGQIPSEIGLLTGMQDIWLYNNGLTGTIPTQLGNLANLQNFQTEGNDLKGSMPSEICINGGLYNGNLQFLATDCTGAGGNVECKCCDCCAFPCLYDM
jgi:Leucine-rich repeat (LRR) protein